jgi:YesN/AraC family two-component response regulator
MALAEPHAAPVETVRVRARVLVVDDHSLLRTGVANIISHEPDLEVVAEAANGRDAVEVFRTHHPDVVLMDLRMPEM